MKIQIQYLIFFSFFCISCQVFAQKKYALVIGINNYYDRPGVLHRSVLRGCVNDATAIKGMLIQRFGFSEANILLLTNENASRKNVDAAFTTLLQKSNPGDAFVFYFSGHGVWMNNDGQSKAERALKMGMNQAIVLSDLYADNLGCLFRDANIKRAFNKFVDKKVIATGIFDCCFAGHLSQATGLDFHNPYLELTPQFSQRSIGFDDVFISFAFNNFFPEHLQHLDQRAFSGNEILDSALITTARAFNMKDSLAINDPSIVVRPSERPRSMFLSLSGTDEYQKGLEMKDAAGDYHGVFTKALLQVINDGRNDIPVKDLFSKIQALIKQKGFTQTPMRFQDPQRSSRNLIGLSAANFKPSVEAVFTRKTKNTYELSSGKSSGLAVGNVLSLNGNKKSAQLKVVAVEQNAATAELVAGKGLQIGKGARFVRTDNFTKSKPLIKLFLNLQPIAPTTFQKYMYEIIPLAQLKNYRSYSNWYMTEESRYIFLNNTGFTNKKLLEFYAEKYPDSTFFVFLPLPQKVLAPFRKLLLQNQNFDLVENPAKANFVLYLNYTPEDGGNYVFTWAPPLQNHSGVPMFYLNHYKIQQLPSNSKGITSLTSQLMEMTTVLAQQYTGAWLNDQKKK